MIIEEGLKDLDNIYNNRLEQIRSIEDKDLREITALTELCSGKDPFSNFKSNFKGQQLSKADGMFINAIEKKSKEYMETLYQMAKPFIEDRFNINKQEYSNKDSNFYLNTFTKIKEKLSKIEEVEQDKIKQESIKMLFKGYVYYIRSEFDNCLNPNCRKLYYEIWES